MKSLIICSAVFVVALSACGESRPLQNVGAISEGVLHGESTTTLTIVIEETGEAIPIGGAADADWFSDDLGVASDDYTEVVASVVARYDGSETFIQASRQEIVIAVPGIQFPRLLPDVADYVTSQLVVDPVSASIEGATSAAFGFWSAVPYTVNRAEGQVAVLRVGVRADAAPEAEIITRSQVDEGISLQWSLQELRYELFCRSGLVEESCWEMAENLVPLASLLP